LACHLKIDADPDQVYHFDADPDAFYHVDVDPDPDQTERYDLQHCLQMKIFSVFMAAISVFQVR
jgi:hypothetical protein